MKTLRGVIHGKAIELDEEPGLPDGQEVSVDIQPIRERAPAAGTGSPWWLDHFEVNPTIKPGKFVVKGTAVLVDELVTFLEQRKSEDELLRIHAKLTPKDVAAVREYAKLPAEMRRSFGAWAEDANELDQYLDWNRQQRKTSRRRMED
jgi:uncharacterized protein (DUF433 family)